MRSSAQGLFMIMTNGLGATVGTLGAMYVVNTLVPSTAAPEVQLEGWRTCWYIFAGYALAVAILFMLIFKDDRKAEASEKLEGETAGDPEGLIDVK